MLEGQVSILSSQMLSGKEALFLLESLRHSPLYREDQHTYLLYPDKTLPGFLEKNRIPEEKVWDLNLVRALVEANDTSLMSKDKLGFYHFNGSIHNIKDVERILGELSDRDEYIQLVAQETEDVKHLFEEIFRHSEFTGRSGTFFAYEGLGSVYWHMVAKLLLAVQEVIFYEGDEKARSGLIQKYREIRAGLGFNKSPVVYGAFPTDPYSHTPKGQGAKQPGMTGLVKEEILTRLAELGFTIRNGCISFDFQLLDQRELLQHPFEFSYYDIDGVQKHIQLQAQSLAFTICQIPIIINKSNQDAMIIRFKDGGTQIIQGHVLDEKFSSSIFLRDGTIQNIQVKTCKTGV
jgi:hypothetical protein